MTQLPLDPRQATKPARQKRVRGTRALLLSLAERYEQEVGPITDLRAYVDWAGKEGAFARYSLDHDVQTARMYRTRNAFQSLDGSGLPHRIYTGACWISLRIATKDEFLRGYQHLENGPRKDLKRLRRLYDYGQLTFGEMGEFVPVAEEWLMAETGEDEGGESEGADDDTPDLIQ